MKSRRVAGPPALGLPQSDETHPTAGPDSKVSKGLDLETRRLLGSTSNYLSASAFLLLDLPEDRDEAMLRVERADLLIREAAGLVDLVKRREG